MKGICPFTLEQTLPLRKAIQLNKPNYTSIGCRFFLSLSLLFLGVNLSQAQNLNRTELYIIGTVHESSSILNPEMLFGILDTIRPDILLQENDSMQIAEYTKEIRPNSNEQTATLKFLKKYPKTLNLPFEFEGRNQYRRDNGMVPTDNLTI